MSDRMLAEFADEEALARAILILRERGYRELDAYLPYPSHEVEAALARPRSRLPFVICLAGVTAASAAYALQWLLVAYLYPLVVGGRPPHFPLAFVIITFEMGVLFAAATAFVGTLVLGRLVRLRDEVQGTSGFESVTCDHFWVEVAMRDAAYDEQRTRELLDEAGALRVVIPEVLA